MDSTLNSTLDTGTQQQINDIIKQTSGDGGMFAGLTMWSILFGIFIGFVGLAYIRYGKQSSKFMPIISGILMLVYPYFVYNIWYCVIIAIVLCVIPIFLKY